MKINYSRLLRKMKEQDINKTQLGVKANVSTNQIAKIAKGEPLTVEALIKIASVLHCNVEDIFKEEDIIKNKSSEK